MKSEIKISSPGGEIFVENKPKICKCNLNDKNVQILLSLTHLGKNSNNRFSCRFKRMYLCFK